MVMPCSRSALSPSVTSEKSKASPLPFLADAWRTASIWSSGSEWVSCSSRPISVDLPSSTLPSVQMRTRSGTVMIVSSWTA